MLTSTFRESAFRRYLQSKLESLSTVHGVNHLCEKTRAAEHSRRWLVWSAILLANVALTVAFLIVIHNNYNTDQIVTKINENCKIEKVPFPAVSICNFNMISFREITNITATLKQHKRTNSDIEIFFKNLPNLKDYKKIQDNVTNLMETMAVLKQHYYTIDSVMEEVHQKCEDLLLYCTFNRKIFECKDRFRLTKTFEGYCCMFNYVVLNDIDQEQVILGEKSSEWEYYVDTDNREVTSIISTSEFGRSSGLSVVFNIEANDYPAFLPTLHYGAKIIINDPNDYAETTVLTKLASVGESVELKVQPMVFQSESSLRQVSPQRRACWFHDEVQLAHTQRYSFETCMTECTMTGYRDLCHCLPYKYPKEKGIRRLASCSIPCYNECIDKKYSMTSDVVPLTHADTQHLQSSVAASELMSLRVYYKKATCSCYTLSLLMDLNYFIATYGGVFSLLFGGSLITVFELGFIVASTLVSFIRRKFFPYDLYNNYYIP